MTLNFVEENFYIGQKSPDLSPQFIFYKRGFRLGGNATPSWKEITLSGVGAVTLVNAINEGLLSLTLFGDTEQLPETYIDSVTLDGKCEQNGTPTPTVPVDIVCNNGAIKYGALGNNLADVTADNVVVGQYIGADGTIGSNDNNFYYSKFIKVQPNTSYTLSFSESVYFASISEYSTANDSGFVVRKIAQSSVTTPPFDITYITITTGATTNYIRFGSNVARNTITLENVLAIDWMLNIGSTAMPYEPYREGIYTDGITETVTDSNSLTATAEMLLSVGDYKDTQEVLSGSVTRNVGIKVLDGTENWTEGAASPTFKATLSIVDSEKKDAQDMLCSHFKSIKTNITSAVQDNQCAMFTPGGEAAYDKLVIGKYDMPNLAAWKQWLSDQYQAGTPVIIVYPLATATTETVTPQVLQKEPVTVTGSLTGLVANVVSSSHTTPTPTQPLPINTNNGVLRIQGSATGTVTQDGDPTPTEPIYPVFYQKGNLVLRAVDGYADTYNATTQTITRNIGMAVLDGTKRFTELGTPNCFRFGFDDRGIAGVNPICSHYPDATITLSVANMPDKTIKGHATAMNSFYLKDSRFSTEEELQAWLASQYNAGTPVTVYYVLETPITERFTPNAYADGTVETVEVTGKNLYNKENGVLFGYPTGNNTWYQKAEATAELTIMVRLKEGSTYTATRAEGSVSTFRIQASATSTLTDGQTLVDIDFSEYRRKHDNRMVKKNCTIPYYLNVEAEKRGLNFSRLLQEALLSKING